MTDYQKATCWWLAAFFLVLWAVAAGEGGLAYTPAFIAGLLGALFFLRQFFRPDGPPRTQRTPSLPL